MATILSLASNQPPSSIASGSWPAAMRTGKWKFSFTPTQASSTFTTSVIWQLFFLGTDQIQLNGYGSAGRALLSIESGANFYDIGDLSFSAGQTITLEFDNAAGKVTISGATAGNGTYTTAAPFTLTNGTLYIGRADWGGYVFPGTFSDVSDVAITGTAAASVLGLVGAGFGPSSITGTAAGVRLGLVGFGSPDPTILVLAGSQPPSIISSGGWPAQMASGRWRFSCTPNQASSALTTPSVAVWELFAFSAGEIFLSGYGTPGAALLSVYDSLGVGHDIVDLTFSAGQTLNFEFNTQTGAIVVSGATTGNGSYSTAPFTFSTAGSLYVGSHPDGRSFPGTFSNVYGLAATAITATTAGVRPGLTAAAVGGLSIGGSAAGVRPGLIGVSAGTLTMGGSATAAGVLPGLVGAGVQSLTITGTAVASLVSKTGAAAGSLSMGGTAAGVRPGLTGAGIGVTAIAGTAAGQASPGLTARSLATADFAANAVAIRLHTGNEGGLVPVGKEDQLYFQVSNQTAGALTISLSYTLTKPDATTSSASPSASVPAKSVVRFAISLSGQAYGHRWVDFSASWSGGSQSTSRAAFHYVPSLAGQQADSTGFELGMCMGFTPQAADYAASRDIGVTHIRSNYEWSGIEVPDNNYHWEEPDAQVAIAELYGMRVMWMLAYEFYADSSRAPPNSAQYASFCTNMVNRYTSRIFAYEVWNESNNTQFWAGNASQYITMLQAAYNAIKAARPTALVLTSGFAGAGLPGVLLVPNVEKNTLETASSYYDVHATHPHGDLSVQEATFTGTATWRANQTTQRPMWSNEVGRNTAGGLFLLQAQETVKKIAVSRALGLIGFTIYEIKDSGTSDVDEQTYGIMTPTRAPKPALGAINEATRRLRNRAYVGVVSGLATANRAYVFGSGSSFVTCLFRQGGGSATIDLYVSPGSIAYDMWGNNLSIPITGGKMAIPFGASPVYLETPDPPSADPENVTGTVAAARPGLTGLGTGTLTISGTASAIRPGLVGSAVASSTIVGAIVAARPGITAAASGSLAVSGSALPSLPALIPFAASSSVLTGSAAGVRPSLVGSATGGSFAISGAGAGRLSTPRGLAQAANLVPITGTASAALTALVGSDTGGTSDVNPIVYDPPQVRAKQFTFRDAVRAISPPWLSKGDAEAVLFTIGLHLDTMMDAQVIGIKSRFPTLYSNESLPIIGQDRRIRRGRLDTDESYALRLSRWLDDHATRGGPYALLAQVWAHFAPANFTAQVIYRSGRRFSMAIDGSITRSDIAFAGYPADNIPEKWARWWLVYDWPTPVGKRKWGDGMKWGDGHVWGSDLSPAEVVNLRLVPREWGNAHSFGYLILRTAAGDVRVGLGEANAG